MFPESSLNIPWMFPNQMMMIISLFGLIGLLASSLGCEMYAAADNEPVWPTSAVRVLLGVRDV
jgi:hypothetical protein